FLLALSMYVYLPIRTEVGAAIRWGEPNTLDRFIAHVTASAHREGYVLTKSPLEYLLRTKDALIFVLNQFGALLLLALWGWLKIPRMRWRIFFLGVITFDLVYTIFLNIISFEITAFTLPTCIALAILIGIGTAHILKEAKNLVLIGKTTHRALSVAFCAIPLIPLALNFDLCNQSGNYTGYENALNIFRTVDNRSTLFLDGDNNIFPVAYARIVERMREDVMLYDRPNIIFKMPYPDNYKNHFYGKWEEFRPIVEKSILESAQNGIYYAVFNPYAVFIPDQFVMYPCGILYKAIRAGVPFPEAACRSVWTRYVTESIYDNLHKDFMNRHVCAHFHFSLGKYLFMIGKPVPGLKEIKWASQIAYDDTMIHSDIALLLIDQGFFEEARSELEKALIYYDDLGGVYTNWGHYYYELRDYDEAIKSFRQAVKLDPDNFDHYNNLGLALYQAGRNDEAAAALHQSLSMNRDQPKVETFLQEHPFEERL
ncbi:MAG: tetratricopeptide repeat protein, partial [Deltaproteobacteria bacterium]|nr:tetratricopeptide repeat protein [Deltaproteobacteria bacterium]